MENIDDIIDCPEPENFLDYKELKQGYTYQPNDEECIHNLNTGICGGSCEQPFLKEALLSIIIHYLDEYGLQEFKSESTEEINGEIIRTTKVLKGVFTDLNRHIAIIHPCANIELLPNNFSERLNKVIDVKNLYVGINYLLAKTDNNIFSFNIKLYKKITDLIQSMYYDIPIQIEKHVVSENGSLFSLITSDGTQFIISGLLNNNTYEKEERLLLSQKVEEAKPFFQFEPFSKVDWSKLKSIKGTSFEALCEIILQSTPTIIEVQSIGKTNAADRGRDFIVIEETFDLSGKKLLKWLVQCKYSEKSVSPSTISGWSDRIIEHNIDGYWLMTNNDYTPSLYDQLNDSSKNEKFKVQTRIWARNKFDLIFNLQNELFSKELFD